MTVSFVIFHASSISEALGDIRCLFVGGNLPPATAAAVYYLRSFLFLLILAALGATPLPARLYRNLRENRKTAKLWAVLEPAAMIGLLLLSTAYLVNGSFHPFLYFRF